MAAHCAANSSRSSAGSVALARILRLEIAQMIRLLFARLPRHRPGHCPVIGFSVPDNGSSNQLCSVFAGRGFGPARAALQHAGEAGPDLRDLDQEDGHAHPRRDGPRASPAHARLHPRVRPQARQRLALQPRAQDHEGPVGHLAPGSPRS